MANRLETSEDPTAGVTEDNDIIYIAVGKDVIECKSILEWALQTHGGKSICILHVHELVPFIPLMGGKFPASSLNEMIVGDYRKTERQKMHKIMDEYLLFCRQMGAWPQKLIIETDCIEKGIVELIYQNGIRKLVMGAAAKKHHILSWLSYTMTRRKMMDLKSNKAKYVRQHAPAPCHIQFIYNGHLIFTREATETGQPNPVRSMSVTLLRDNTETGESNDLRLRSVTVGFNRDRGGITSLAFSDIPIPEGTEELSSPKSRFLTPEESFHLWDLPITISPPDLGCSEYFSTLSSPFGYLRSSFSVDVSSCLQPPIPSLSTSSSSGAHSVMKGENGLPLGTHSCTGALSGVDKSLDINTFYEKLLQARAKAKKEILRSQKAEKDLIEALCRAQKELIHRKTEEALAKDRELKEVKNQINQLMEKLRVSQEQGMSLKSPNAELQKGLDELQVENNALKEAEGLRRKQEGSMGDMPQFLEFSLSEIEQATQSFNGSLKIGEGGYGNIYKGILRQITVAMKRLHSQRIHSHGVQGPLEFQMEVGVLSQLRHPNLVKLIGSCPKVFALIYEYLPNGSLEDRLNMRDNSPPLSWQTRIRIATELCSVLVYLHSANFVHGDLKPSNIFLDANFVSKLSDFGICRMLFPDASSGNNATLCRITVPKGTPGYIDPEFFETGVLTLKSDIYSFGIILLQLLTGRNLPCMRKQPISISNEVKSALHAGDLKALLDPLAGDWPIVVAQKLAHLGLRCCDWNRRSRPDFGSEVWEVLEPMRDLWAASFSS